MGIEVMRSSEGILLDQRKYTLQLISDLGLGETKPAATPIHNEKFTFIKFDEHVGVTRDEVLKDVSSYQRLIDRLIYLIITRPGVILAVQILSQFMQSPK